MIHNANHIRPNRDGLKVGGHQASCACVISIMTALYFEILRPQDRVAVKPHAGPVFHAINLLFGRQTPEKMAGLRQFGGAQSYPEPHQGRAGGRFLHRLGRARRRAHQLRRADAGLRAAARPRTRGAAAGPPVAIAGDAELDEGNIYEALLEGWKHDVRNVWWIIDYNRQSLDSVVPDRLFGRIEGLFRDMGWNVVTLKYGRKLQAAFAREGGEALRRWIDDCPNSLYSALTFQGGAAWRQALLADLGRDPRRARHHRPAVRRRAGRADDQSRRPRRRLPDRELPRRPTPRATSRPASSPTPSRAWACPSPATRTTIPA